MKMTAGHSTTLAHILLCIGLLFACTFVAFAELGRGFNFSGLAQLALKRYGTQAQQTVEQWRDLLSASRNVSDTEKIRRVNDFFNRKIFYNEDIEIWGQSDYWATPLEVMGRGVADCEDFAIVKYFSLLILGIPADHLRITYVKARLSGGSVTNLSIAHMVLAYYPSLTDEPLILDNLNGDILSASRRPDLTPVFGFNSEGIWIGTAPGGKSAGSSTARLSRWRHLLSRMKEDGFE